MASPEIRIGTSGYRYDHWRGSFYPEELAKQKWLATYSRTFSTVEINNTFYGLPSIETTNSWKQQADSDFRFAVKFSRYGTHMKKLKDPQEIIDRFLEAVTPLGKKLGPILVQLPPNWNANPERLATFLETFPNRQRIAVEFRDSSWLCSEVFAVLKNNNSAICVHDKIADHPLPEVADWCYYRFHGDDYGGCYSYQKLTAVAGQLAEKYSDGKDIFVFFNNDADGFAPKNARDLERYLDSRISE